MKNFKRVISAVIALALSVSSFAAVSASKFTDVADTAIYAEAVEVLTALGIVNGYEDGTFKPEGEITRAEAATMIVGAINMTEDAKASAGTTQFTDVNTQASWAAGYINVGVSQGFINGMDATTFAPQNNVTYAQMCVMLTSITGYDEYAAENGGYPKGYTSMAASAGINKGVAVADNTNLTRGQVALMIYNALKAPMLGVSTYSSRGNEYVPLDGTAKAGNEFKTLLSDKFDAYVVTGLVTQVPTTGSEIDEVALQITKADYWDGIIVNKAADLDDTNTLADESVYAVKYLATGAQDRLFQSGTGIIRINEDDENELLYFVPNSRTTTKEVEAADFDEIIDDTNDKVKFDAKSYTLDASYTLYVNGASVGTPTAAQFQSHIDEAVGTVTLLKMANDTNYSKVFINKFVIAEVSSVVYKSEKTTVNLKNPEGYTGATLYKIVINDDTVADGDVIVSVKKDGADIELKELVAGDVIAVQAVPSVLALGTITDESIRVTATNATAEGTLTYKDNSEKIFAVGGTDYQAVDFTQLYNDNADDGFKIKNQFTLVLDPFGRIYDYKTEASSVKVAIVERVDAADKEIVLYSPEGTATRYEYDCTIPAGVVTAANARTLANITDRVVQYTYKKSTDTITSVTAIHTTANEFGGDITVGADYKSRSGKIGSFAVADATLIIDAQDYEGAYADYKTMTAADLVDDSNYKGAGYNKTSDYYGFIIITDAGTVLGEDSRFAVVTKAPYEGVTNDDYQDDCYILEVLYNGEETTLYVEMDATGIAGVDFGDIIYVETTGEGLVKAVTTVYAAGQSGYTLSGYGTKDFDAVASLIDATAWNVIDDVTTVDVVEDVRLVAGIVTDVTSKSVSFIEVPGADATINLDNDVYDYGIADEAVLYMFDTTVSGSNLAKKFDIATPASAIASNFDQFLDAEEDNILWDDDAAVDNPNDFANYAVAMVVDGDIVAMFEIIK